MVKSSVKHCRFLASFAAQMMYIELHDHYEKLNLYPAFCWHMPTWKSQLLTVCCALMKFYTQLLFVNTNQELRIYNRFYYQTWNYIWRLIICERFIEWWKFHSLKAKSVESKVYWRGPLFVIQYILYTSIHSIWKFRLDKSTCTEFKDHIAGGKATTIYY